MLVKKFPFLTVRRTPSPPYELKAGEDARESCPSTATQAFSASRPAAGVEGPAADSVSLAISTSSTSTTGPS